MTSKSSKSETEVTAEQKSKLIKRTIKPFRVAILFGGSTFVGLPSPKKTAMLSFQKGQWSKIKGTPINIIRFVLK